MTTSLFVIVNVKQLRTQVVLEFYCPFFRTSWCVGILNSAIFNVFHNRVEFGTILEGLRNFEEEGLNPPPHGTPLECVMLRSYYSFKHCGLITHSKLESLFIIHSNICSITYCGQIKVIKSDQQSVLSIHN